MKSKLKLNPAGIKPLAMQHGEKAVFGLGVVALVMFLWSASKTEVLGPEKQAEPLKESANKSDAHIQTSKWDPKAKGIEVVDYVSRAKRDPLNDKDYRHLVYWDKPLWEQKGKRPDPKVLPVEELLASAGSGVFSMSIEEQELGAPGAPGGAGPRRPGMGPGGMMPGPGGAAAGRRGDKDKKAAPEPAPPPRRRVARRDVAEPKGVRVNSKSNLKGFSWVLVTGLVPVRKQEAEFEEAFRNVILNDDETDVPEYNGMRIQRAEVTTSNPDQLDWKEVPLKDLLTFKVNWQTEAKDVIDETYIDPLYTMPLAPLVGEDWDPKIAGHDKIPAAVKMVQKVRPKGNEINPDDEDEVIGVGAAPRRKNDEFGVEPPARDRRRGNNRPGAGARHTDQTLFRIIDNTVRSGKSYRYRVMLRLANPNLGKAEKYLKDPASRVKKVVYSPWSEPTPLITVPGDIDVFAGRVAKASKEPTMKALVKRLDFENGRVLKAESEFTRGSIINIRKTIEMEGPDGGPVKIENAELNSHSLVVDIEGGKPLKGLKSPTTPGEMVILHPDGRLEVRDELGDELAYRTILPPEPEEAKDDSENPDNPYNTKPKTKKSRHEQMKEDNKKKKAKQND